MVSLETFMDFFSRGRSRVRPRFFDQVGNQTTNAYIGNKYIFTKLCHHQTYQNYENLVKDLKILSFKVIFQCLKLVESFKKKNSHFFENFDFRNTLFPKIVPNFCQLCS